MRNVQIPKGSGGFRTVYIPSAKEKTTLRAMVGQLTKKAARACPEGVCHGFTYEKSPVTNALAHVGHAFTLCFDLTDFFDSVTAERLAGKLTKEELSLVLVDGAARQGLPTSPAVANLAASDMDKAILKFRDKQKLQFIYTRYADDLSFSYDDATITYVLMEEVPKCVSRCGFRVNEKKTKLQTATAGRRIITGVAVSEQGIHPTREVKRKLRAARHQKQLPQQRGLEEWCKLKEPRERTSRAKPEELDSLCSCWKLPRLKADKLPDKGPDEIIGCCVVTGDPVYMLGMSTFTTGWTSCMAQPNGQYRRGVIFWCYLRGTCIAALLSSKTKTVAGVERRVMKARALVHSLRDGRKIYDRLYGSPSDCDTLRSSLEAAGYIPVKAAGSCKVVGHVVARYKPYLDSLRSFKNKASEGQWKGKTVYTVGL